MKYDDILSLSRPYSPRIKMSMEERAAQFAPFAALNGYEEAIEETARIVEKRITFDEETYRLLDITLQELKERIGQKPLVRYQYFKADLLKEGGSYIEKEDRLLKIDTDHHCLIFENEKTDIDDICYLEAL